MKLLMFKKNILSKKDWNISDKAILKLNIVMLEIIVLKVILESKELRLRLCQNQRKFKFNKKFHLKIKLK